MKNTVHTVIETGERLDKYLAAQNLATSRSEASQWIRDGRVMVNHRIEKASYTVQLNDQIQINKPDLRSTNLKPHPVPFDVVYEDEFLLILNKPAGVVVHPAPGNYETSLVHGLLYHCREGLSGIGGVERPGIVHRLDKGTSGLMVVAKTDVAHQKLTQQFQNRTIQKEYRALALFSIEKQEQTLVNLMKRSETNRKKFVVNQKSGKTAITYISVLQKNAKCSYVSVKIETGRTHQIRVHLRSINHPIMGDELYGGTQKLHGFSPEDVQWIRDLHRPLLHSHRLAFTHPILQKELDFTQPIPDDFTQALQKFFG